MILLEMKTLADIYYRLSLRLNFKRAISLIPTIILSLQACAPALLETKGSKTAIASWYGAEFHGRPTASGEIFDMNKKTCAHREYPFGTRLRITNLNNQKSVECIVNDRGPFVQGRDIDLSYGAAREIGLIATGTAPVIIEYRGREETYRKEVKKLAITGPYTIQIGSFRDRDNALRLKEALNIKYSGIYILESRLKDEIFFRVRMGRFSVLKEAMEIASRLAEEGYPAIIVQTE